MTHSGGWLCFCLREAHRTNVDNSISTLSSQTKKVFFKETKKEIHPWSEHLLEIQTEQGVQSVPSAHIFSHLNWSDKQRTSDCFQAKLCFLAVFMLSVAGSRGSGVLWMVKEEHLRLLLWMSHYCWHDEVQRMSVRRVRERWCWRRRVVTCL